MQPFAQFLHVFVGIWKYLYFPHARQIDILVGSHRRQPDGQGMQLF